MSNLFLVTSRYLIPIEKLDAYRADHLVWARQQAKEGTVLFGGARVPRDGAVIIVKAASKDAALRLFDHDPYVINRAAKYEVAEFQVVVAADAFAHLL